MSIILKHTLKNVFKKPFRLILMTFCLCSCAIAALLCFDMSGALDSVMKGALGNRLGNADIVIMGNDKIEELMEDKNLPENDVVYTYEYKNNYYTDVKDQYTYVHKEEISICGLNCEKAGEFGLYKLDVIPGDGEIIISQTLADHFECKVGASNSCLFFNSIPFFKNFKNGSFIRLERIQFLKFSCFSTIFLLYFSEYLTLHFPKPPSPIVNPLFHKFIYILIIYYYL